MVLFLVNLICAGLAFAVAESKGHRTWMWLLTAFLLGPLGLLAAVGLSDRKTHRLLASIARASDQIEGELERFKGVSLASLSAHCRVSSHKRGGFQGHATRQGIVRIRVR
jgi:hypothetical protein